MGKGLFRNSMTANIEGENANDNFARQSVPGNVALILL